MSELSELSNFIRGVGGVLIFLSVFICFLGDFLKNWRFSVKNKNFNALKPCFKVRKVLKFGETAIFIYFLINISELKNLPKISVRVVVVENFFIWCLLRDGFERFTEL